MMFIIDDDVIDDICVAAGSVLYYIVITCSNNNVWDTMYPTFIIYPLLLNVIRCFITYPVLLLHVVNNFNSVITYNLIT